MENPFTPRAERQRWVSEAARMRRLRPGQLGSPLTPPEGCQPGGLRRIDKHERGAIFLDLEHAPRAWPKRTIGNELEVLQAHKEAPGVGRHRPYDAMVVPEEVHAGADAPSQPAEMRATGGKGRILGAAVGEQDVDWRTVRKRYGRPRGLKPRLHPHGADEATMHVATLGLAGSATPGRFPGPLERRGATEGTDCERMPVAPPVHALAIGYEPQLLVGIERGDHPVATEKLEVFVVASTEGDGRRVGMRQQLFCQRRR